jgi:hypothetical protein
MSHSYSSNRIHLVFSTKNRAKLISEELQLKLWPCMAGIAQSRIRGNQSWWRWRLYPCALALAGDDSAGKGNSNLEIMLIKMAERYRHGGEEFCLAARLWRLQRQRFADGCHYQVH